MEICKQMRPLSYDIKALNGRKNANIRQVMGVVSTDYHFLKTDYHFLKTYCHFLKTALTANQRCMPMVRRRP